MKPKKRSTLVGIVAISLFIVMISCGQSAQQKKANSPECLAAKKEAAEHQAKFEMINAEIRAGNETKRMQLENLRLDDRLAELQGRPIKNFKAEALLETSIRANEIGLEHAPEMENLSRSIDQSKIQEACEIPERKQ
jgi:hypothetical protein